MSGKAWATANMFRKTAAPPPAGADVGAWLAGLQLGAAQKAGELELWPLLHPAAEAEADLLAPEAIAAGVLQVTEKDGGTVQELTAANRGPRPVILIEGEVLLGAKQNRMVAHTIVIAPGATVVVPVGCVEKGRWTWRTREFVSSDRVMDSEARSRAKWDVINALRQSGFARVNQRKVWDAVDEIVACEGVQSDTTDYNEVLRKRAAEDEAFARTVEPVDRQVGLMAIRHGVMVGFDVVGSAATWRGVSARFLRSLMPESKPGRTRAAVRRMTAPEWLTSLNSVRIERKPSAGLGEDVVFADAGLLGSGVWLGSRPAHISAFARPS